VRLVFEPRFDYARARTSVEKVKGVVMARRNKERILLSSTHEIHIGDDRAETRWRLAEGALVWLHLKYGSDERSELDPKEAERALQETRDHLRCRDGITP
jgi:hypothetical protein